MNFDYHESSCRKKQDLYLNVLRCSKRQKICFKNKLSTNIAADYLREGGATNNERDLFIIIVAHLKMEGEKHVMEYIGYRQSY